MATLPDSTILARADRSSELTWVRATQEQFLRPTNRPSRDLPLTMQYGTPMSHTVMRHSNQYAITHPYGDREWEGREQFRLDRHHEQ